MKRCPGQRFMAIYQHVHFSRMRKNSTSTSTLSLLPLTLNHDRTQTPALSPPPTLAPPLLPPPCCCPPPSHTHSLNFVIRWTVKIVRLDPLTLLCLHCRGEQDQDDQYQAYDAPPLPTPDEAYGCRWVVPRLTHAHAARGLPYYRDALDRLTEDQVTWDPYVPDLVDAMPPHLLDHQAEWRARVPLICFEVVESHLPDRVMRQFGLRQTIPQGCDTSVQLHGIDRRGKGETSWALEHWRFLQLWEQRLEFIVGGDLMQGAMDPDDPYMVWYRRITRRFINPSYAPPSTHYHPAYDIISGYAADMVAMVDALSVSLECGPTRAQVEQVRDMGVATLRRYGHAHLAHRRDGHDGNSQFDLGQSSGGCDPTSPRHAEDYNIHSTAPSGTQEDPSSSQLTPPPPRDPFTTVTHYRRRRVRRRADTQEAGPLPRINESG
ncbi:serine/threonine-protein phosphatase 7 long form homolog [Chenopodium quinoa]|uniref:serine/threonine-protein phosphatase 7 long form homolog n=1 Tax=Chenopodium quinoa TaxID=63459 RepID=UPI000B77FEBF|nr:serine/threonine-protein phosphatase 7 long form homolog [Chenopodium quinoa]